MNRNLLKISFSKSNLAAVNILKESLLRMPVLMYNSNVKYGSYADNCDDKNDKKMEKIAICARKKKVNCRVKPKPCPPKACKPPRFDCPPNDPPDHCPYKPPKCKKPCIDGPKPCIPPKQKTTVKDC